MSAGVGREITLDELVARLGEEHLAARQLAALRREVTESNRDALATVRMFRNTEAERDALREHNAELERAVSYWRAEFSAMQRDLASAREDAKLLDWFISNPSERFGAAYRAWDGESDFREALRSARREELA